MAKTKPAAVVESAQTPHDPYALTPEELARAMNRIPIIRAWCDGVEAAAQAALVQGQEVPGYRLGFNHPKQRWADPEKVFELATKAKLSVADFAPPELLAPGKFISLCKRMKVKSDHFMGLITRNEPKLVVTENDNTYYDTVNAVDLAQHLAKQHAPQGETGAVPARRTKRKVSTR